MHMYRHVGVHACMKHASTLACLHVRVLACGHVQIYSCIKVLVCMRYIV